MLSRVETPGCFLAAAAASGAGGAAQVRSDGQRLPCVACLGPGSCLHRCLRSHLRLAQGNLPPESRPMELQDSTALTSPIDSPIARYYLTPCSRLGFVGLRRK